MLTILLFDIDTQWELRVRADHLVAPRDAR